jgi:nucleotide-binding universal stress UspA family protein
LLVFYIFKLHTFAKIFIKPFFMSKQIILIPVDFSNVSRVAMEHGVKLAQTINGEILLLHVVEGNTEVAAAKKKLEEEEKLITRSDANVSVKSMVRIGNIFDDIGDTASEVDARLIIMGTHGAKGWQKIAGSHALKVITHSNVPFLVVQNTGIKESGYDDIVVPLDLNKETKQKLDIVSNMARYFDSKIHIIAPYETDEFLVHKLNGNIAFAKKFLKDRGIVSTVKIAEKGKNFTKEIIKHAKEVDADLISIMNLGRTHFMGLGGSEEQDIIANEANIPVMCVNPVSTTVSSGSVLFS